MSRYYCACGECAGTHVYTYDDAIACHQSTRADSSSRSSLVMAIVPSAKSSNPKDDAGTTRAPLHAIPVAALVEEALAMLEGILKYGSNNWTIEGVRASVYVAAAARHTFKWFFGQQRDSVTQVHHLASARACLGILLDAEFRQVLRDDRPPSLNKLDELFTNAENVAKNLFSLYGDVKPKHYTIEDTK
jgi:hypothetical protein